MHDDWFLNVAFLAKQILGVLGSKIEIVWIFSLVRMLIVLNRNRLQVKNMDRIITLVKNWLDDPHANCKPHSDFKQYVKTKKSLAKENYNWRIGGWWCLISLGWGGFVFCVGGAGNLCYNWAKFFIELGFDFPTNYFEFVHVAFVLQS